MARKPRTSRLERVEAVTVDVYERLGKLEKTARRLSKRVAELEADEAKDAIGFRVPQSDEDPDVEEMP